MLRRSIGALFILLLLAACGGSAAPTSTPPPAPTEAAAAPEPTDEPTTEPTDEPTTAPQVELGDEVVSAEGGYSFRPVAAHEVLALGETTTVIPDDADDLLGPMVMVAGGPNDDQIDLDTALEQFVSEAGSGQDIELANIQDITVSGAPAKQADITGTQDGTAMAGRIVIAVTSDDEQGFVMFGLGPETLWENAEFQAMLDTVSLFAPEVTASTTDSIEAPPLDAEPGWHYYTNRNEVWDIAFHDGLLWAATGGGVVAWNPESGEQTTYGLDAGLSSIGTYAVEVCPVAGEPRVIFGTETGILAYNPGSDSLVQAYEFPADSSINEIKITQLRCDTANNQLLIGASGPTVYNLADGSLRSYEEEDGLTTTSIGGMNVINNALWVSTSYKGVAMVEGDQVTTFTEEQGNLPEDSTYDIAGTPDGTVWLGSGTGIMRYQGGEWSLIELENRMDARHIIANADGTLWFADIVDGLCRFDPASQSCAEVYELPFDAGYGNPYITSLTMSEDGQIAFSTNGNGITLLRDGNATELKTDDQVLSNYVTSIGQDYDGTLLFGTDKGVNMVPPTGLDGQWSVERYSDTGLRGSWIDGIYRSPEGGVWFTSGANASYMTDAGWSAVTREEGIPSSIRDMDFASDGTIWMATDAGLATWDGVTTTVKTEADGLPSDYLSTVTVDAEDTIWIGTRGLAKVVDGEIEVVDDSLTVRDIHILDDGALLLATDDGVVRYVDGQTKLLLEIPYTGGLFGSSGANEIAFDSSDNYWVASGQGLFYSNDQGTSWENYTTENGLLANYINDIYIDANDTVWLGAGYTDGGGGLMRFIP